jgi:hypothetical protein
MEVFRKQRQEAIGVREIEELSTLLGHVTHESCVVTEFDGTYEIEAQSFSLTCTLEAPFFEIRNIDTRGHKGLGKEIVSAVHDFADAYDFEVIAGMVKDEARGF